MEQRPDLYLGTEQEIVVCAGAFVMAGAYDAVAHHSWFALVLSGGNSPRPLHAVLASGIDEREFARCGLAVPKNAERSPAAPSTIVMPWNKTWLFQGDERCVPPAHPDSNYSMAFETLISHVDIDPTHCIRMAAEEECPETAAQKYERKLKRFFRERVTSEPVEWPRFDLVILGIGNDGHTASLFPGSSALQERSRWVVATKAPPESPVRERLSLTLPAINHATTIMFFVSGNKESLAFEVYRGKRRDLPAAKVGDGSSTPPVWFIVRQ